MKCPNCNETLVMSERSGVEIDYCPSCRGVWLDRGELDKIIERSVEPTQNRHFQDTQHSYKAQRHNEDYRRNDEHYKRNAKILFLVICSIFNSPHISTSKKPIQLYGFFWCQLPLTPAIFLHLNYKNSCLTKKIVLCLVDQSSIKKHETITSIICSYALM